jgi:outer membrane usher protein FimD/PapC
VGAGNGYLCAQVADDYFNPACWILIIPSRETDLSVYEKGPGQAPGKYQVSVFINNNKIDTRDVTFRLRKTVAEIIHSSLALLRMI